MVELVSEICLVVQARRSQPVPTALVVVVAIVNLLVRQLAVEHIELYLPEDSFVDLVGGLARLHQLEEKRTRERDR
jgi:hypothetical protein